MSGGHWRRFCFVATLLMLFALPELIAGAFGTVLPLTGAFICYLTLIYNWRTGIAAGFAAGVVLDLAFGRDFPWLVIAFALLVLIAWSFRYNREFRDWPDLILPLLSSLAGSITSRPSPPRMPRPGCRTGRRCGTRWSWPRRARTARSPVRSG